MHLRSVRWCDREGREVCLSAVIRKVVERIIWTSELDALAARHMWLKST